MSSKLSNIDDEVNNNLNDLYTPESLAWRLLVDDDLKDVTMPTLLASIDLSEESQPDIFNKYAYEFEILLTIYLEMVFGWYKLLHLMDCEEKGVDKDFFVDFNKVNFSDLEDPFKTKIKTLGYILNIDKIDKITNKDYYEKLRQESYCRVALRDLSSDYGFFQINKNSIDPEKRYHFIINSNFKGKNNLRDIFMLLVINDVGFKINFVKIHP